MHTNPCAPGRHVFEWKNHYTTTADNEPPDGCICECGLMQYRRKPVQIHESVKLYTRLVAAQTGSRGGR